MRCKMDAHRNREPRAEAISSIEERGCNVEGGSFVFGLMGFIFAMSALAKIRRLEKQLKDAGVLKE
jgi:hypothetical protein